MTPCSKCGSMDIHRDEVNIGVGVQYGPLFCNECGHDEAIKLPEFDPNAREPFPEDL